MIDAAARAAGGDGFLLKLALQSAQPALDHLHDRSLRERLWRASVARGRRGGEHDNRATVAEIAALRAERAGLFGFGSHAEYAIAAQTAGSVAAVLDVLTAVGAAASAAARAEAERHTAALHADGYAGPLEPWDWPYYAARERRARHAVDEARLQEFFVLDRVIEDGLFGVAEALYGLTFVPHPELPRPDPDVRVFAVVDADGGDRGLLYVDAFARDGKAGGAWMDSYAEPAPLLDRRPVVTLTLNAQRPSDGAPALLTPLDVRILFHEFGHGLHMLLSDVRYPRVAGINVADDVVEFPSKIHEVLAVRPDVLARYARHHATGEPLSDADVAALNAFDRDGAPYISTRGAANSLLDQAWHGLAPGETVAADDVDAFESAVLERYGLDVPAVGFHYHSTFFIHIFDGPYPGTQLLLHVVGSPRSDDPAVARRARRPDPGQRPAPPRRLPVARRHRRPDRRPPRPHRPRALRRPIPRTARPGPFGLAASPTGGHGRQLRLGSTRRVWRRRGPGGPSPCPGS